MILVFILGLIVVGLNCLSLLSFVFILFLPFRLEGEEINELLIISIIVLLEFTFIAILTPKLMNII